MLRMMRFDDAVARRQDKFPDKLQPIRILFELWNNTLSNAYVSGATLTVDEQLMTFRRRCSYCQQIPSKPG